jgi:hypothetical protein
LDDRSRAEAMWERMSVPARVGYETVGLNDRFRFYRYASGE